MPHRTNIENSNVISGSTLIGTTVSNTASVQASQVTPEMWAALTRLADTYGKHGEPELVRELKTLLDQGKPAEAKPIWHKIRSFLGDFANVSQIVSTIEMLMH